MRSSSPLCTASNRARTGARLSTGGRPCAARKSSMAATACRGCAMSCMCPTAAVRAIATVGTSSASRSRSVICDASTYSSGAASARSARLGVPLQELLGHRRHDVLRHPRHGRELGGEQRGVVGGQVALLQEAAHRLAPRGRAQRGEQRLDARQHLLAEQHGAVQRDDGRRPGPGRRAASSTATAPPALWPTSNASRDAEVVAERGDVRRLRRDREPLARGVRVGHLALAVARARRARSPGRSAPAPRRPRAGPPAPRSSRG